MYQDKLLHNLADWIMAHGEVLQNRERSNYYTAVQSAEVFWRARVYQIIWVDGMACRIEMA